MPTPGVSMKQFYQIEKLKFAIANCHELRKLKYV